jgi:hypothetical protein
MPFLSTAAFDHTFFETYLHFVYEMTMIDMGNDNRHFESLLFINFLDTGTKLLIFVY